MTENVTNISKVTLDEGDVLVVTVDCGLLPSNESREYMDQIKNYLSVYFFSNKIVVLPVNIKLDIISPTAQIGKDGTESKSTENSQLPD